jgi:hypothetical protein
VVADIAKLSVGREEYYTRELATDHEAYLSGHGESPGRWYGAGATALGVQGEASVAGFQAMFEGRDPTTGELLGRLHGRNAVPAFDVDYRLLAAAPTGIAIMSLQGEGFEDVATCDRLLGDLDRGREQLDARTVLVVDEAGMVGSRKLNRLLEHAQQAQAKAVLVGDARQLATIDAGGGFRALRLRLGASELVENRRQHQAWEREALDLIRTGLVEEAVAAYQAHDRVVAADSKPAATLVLLQDWRTAWQQADHDPPRRSWCWPLAGPRLIGSTPPARSSWPPRAGLEATDSRSKTANWRSGTGSCAATTPSPSSGWPTAAAAPSPPSTPRLGR